MFRFPEREIHATDFRGDFPGALRFAVFPWPAEQTLLSGQPARPNRYNATGLATRMRLRTASSGAQSVKRSNRVASSGLASAFSVGCGQSLPQTIRSGAAFTQ